MLRARQRAAWRKHGAAGGHEGGAPPSPTPYDWSSPRTETARHTAASGLVSQEMQAASIALAPGRIAAVSRCGAVLLWEGNELLDSLPYEPAAPGTARIVMDVAAPTSSADPAPTDTRPMLRVAFVRRSLLVGACAVVGV